MLTMASLSGGHGHIIKIYRIKAYNLRQDLFGLLHWLTRQGKIFRLFIFLFLEKEMMS